MRLQLISSALLSLFLLSTGINGTEQHSTGDSSQIRVMSYNIRYNTPNDGVDAWPNRKDHVADMIGTKYQADIAGLQEALQGQIDDLQERLPEFAWAGQGRDDGKDAGEFSPIFYKKDKFVLLEDNTFWLSENPGIPGSKSWDAAITRIVTWARFRDRASGQEFYFFNTHFDHRGEQARHESAKILAKRIAEVAKEIPVIVTGDFNFRETSDAYAVIAEVPDLHDARYISEEEHQGPTTTSNNWEELSPRPESRIDYIFVREGIRVLNHSFLDDRYDGRFPSDHLPVLTDIIIP